MRHISRTNLASKDVGTGKEANVRIEQSSGLNDTEIERIRNDAQEHASEDKQRRELAEARNQAEHACYQLEKTMKEHADKMTESGRQPLDGAMEKVRDKTKGEDAAAIKSALEELEQASHAFSKTIDEMVQSTGATSDSPDSDSPDSDNSDDAIDAEFEVKQGT